MKFGVIYIYIHIYNIYMYVYIYISLRAKMSTVFLIKYGGTWQQSFEMWSKIHDFKVV
jgi:hypothetical protein